MAEEPYDNEGGLGGKGCIEMGCGCFLVLIIKLVLLIVYCLIIWPFQQFRKKENQ